MGGCGWGRLTVQCMQAFDGERQAVEVVQFAPMIDCWATCDYCKGTP